MISLKMSIAWTATLLYHCLKLAARTNHRYRLDSTIFCIGLIKSSPFVIKNSMESISTIFRDNGKNTKCIYNRALIACRLNVIEYYLCKKADNRIFHCKASSPIIIKQLQSPPIFSAINNYHNPIICINPTKMNASIATDNNTRTSMNENKIEITPKVSVETTSLDINRRSSSRIATVNS
mmetsp:Transcript_47432/g.51232  ORF Transcript_47432/g.51232 Transcript_47432/m.51232 type:complete len:180 (-) Transcript_47432:170-709(-)